MKKTSGRKISLPRIIFLILLILSGISTFTILFLNTEAFTNLCLWIFNKKENAHSALKILNADVLFRIKILSCLFFFTYGLILFFLWNKMEAVLNATSNIFHCIASDIKSFYTEMSIGEKTIAIAALSILVFWRVYLLFELPVNPDEVWMFQSYGKNSPLLSFVWYPLPSNHVLQTFISRCFLFILPQSIISMRVPVVITGIISYIFLGVIADLVLRNKKAALFSALVFAASTGLNTSMVYARGYSFTLLFTLTLVYSFLKLKDTKRISGAYVLLYISIVLGFISVFSFAYNFVSITSFFVVLFFFSKEKDKSLKIIITSLLALLTVAVAYGPIIAINGTEGILIPPHSDEYIYTVLKDHIRLDIIDFFPGFHYGSPLIYTFILTLLFILLFLVNSKANRIILILCLYLFIFPWIIMSVHKVYPSGRMLNYLWAFVSIEAGMLFNLICTNFKERVINGFLILSLVIVYTLNWLILRRGTLGEVINKGHQSEEIAKRLMKDNRRKIFFDDSEYSMMAEYIYSKNDQPITFVYSPTTSEVDALVINKRKAQEAFTPGHLHLQYEDENVSVYYP